MSLTSDLKILRPLSRPTPTAIEVELSQKNVSQLPQPVRDLLVFLDSRDSEADIMEVGICYGGTAALRLSHLPRPRSLVTVDPHGNLPYAVRGSGYVSHMYGDPQELAAMVNLAATASRCGASYQHWKLTSRNFFSLIAPLGYISGGELKPYRFGNVLLDGSHESVDVAHEIREVLPYLAEGGTIVIDNCDYLQADGTLLYDGVSGAATECGLHCAVFDTGDAAWSWDPVAVLSRDQSVLDEITESGK